MERGQFFWRHGTYLLALCFLVVFLVYVPLYTQDGPNRKQSAAILSRLSTSPAEASVYANNLGVWRTNTLFALLYQPLSRVLTPDQYEKCFLGFFLGLLLISFRSFLAVWAPENAALWVIFLPLCFHPLFLKGLYNYLASIPLTLMAFSLLLRGVQRGGWHLFLLFFLCCWVAWLAHPFAFLALGLGFAICLLVEKTTRTSRALLYGSVIGLFLVVGLLWPLWHTPHAMKTPYAFADLPFLVGGMFFLNFPDYSILGFLAVFPFFCMLLWMLWRSVREGSWPKQSLWIAFLVGYLMFPRWGSSGAHLNERFLPFLWLFLPLGLPPLNRRAMRWVYGVSLVTFVLAAGGVTWGMHATATLVKDAQHVLQALPAQARLYPINFRPQKTTLVSSNLTHVWAVYDDTKIVFSPYLFAFPRLTPLVRNLPSSPTYFPATAENFPPQTRGSALCQPLAVSETFACQERRLAAFATMLHNASYYDYWFLHDPPADFVALLPAIPGLQRIAESSKFSLWHYERAKAFQPRLGTP